MLKVMTIVGTRPELIRLSRVIKRLDETVDHVLVHTGQNYDYALNQVFFEDLGIRQPDHMLAVDTSSLGAVLGGTLIGAERVMLEERPDAVLVLGDTNSCIAAVMAMTWGSRAPTVRSASAKTSVHATAEDAERASPVRGSMRPTAWNWSASSSRAG